MEMGGDYKAGPRDEPQGRAGRLRRARRSGVPQSAGRRFRSLPHWRWRWWSRDAIGGLGALVRAALDGYPHAICAGRFRFRFRTHAVWSGSFRFSRWWRCWCACSNRMRFDREEVRFDRQSRHHHRRQPRHRPRHRDCGRRARLSRRRRLCQQRSRGAPSRRRHRSQQRQGDRGEMRRRRARRDILALFKAADAFGTLGALVNNAGIVGTDVAGRRDVGRAHPAHDGGQRHRQHSVRARGGEADVDPPRRPGRRHRQPVVGRRQARLAQHLCRLRRVEGRDRFLHDRPRPRSRRRRHSRRRRSGPG